MTLQEISIRRCGIEDAQILSVVGAATFLDAFAGVLPGRSIVEHCKVNHSVETYTRYLNKPTSAIWLAETVVEQGPIGYAMLTEPDIPIEDPSEDDVELKRIYLLTRFHGTGTGRWLMEAALEGARAMGKKRLLLGMHPENDRALSFYVKSGFRVIGKRTFQIGFNVYEDLVLATDQF